MIFMLRTHLQLALNSLRQNRVRSLLTALGIAIGVASIVLILSLTGGINRLVNEQIQKTGNDLIVIRPSSAKDTVDSIIDELTTSNQYLKSNLGLSDLETITELDSVAFASPLATSEVTISTHSSSSIATIVATNFDLNQIINLPIKTGQFLNPKIKTDTAVVGHDFALKFFGSADAAVTKTFTWGNERFMVVGVLDKLDDPINFNNINFDNAVLVNADHVAEFTDLQIQQINVKTTTTDAVSDTVEQIKTALSAAKQGEQNFSVLSGNTISHPAGSLFTIISSMLAIVAGISLIVGGIGIMNIMLVSVSERTREIGIRKAVGASSGNIMLQFLFESLILSIFGGILGFALGYAIAFLISIATPFAPFISWQIILTTGVTPLLVGLIFGAYPAIKAARQNPIQSLKYYR